MCKQFLAAAYRVKFLPELISKITDVVLPESPDWQPRPLDAMYPVTYLDAIVVKVRNDGSVSKRPECMAIAIDLGGCKHVLGLWLCAGDGGAK
jgi:transposase-like protein